LTGEIKRTPKNRDKSEREKEKHKEQRREEEGPPPETTTIPLLAAPPTIAAPLLEGRTPSKTEIESRREREKEEE
jgi:hypothetical protein